MLGDHHLWAKQAPYPQAFHVPLIIRDPHASETPDTDGHPGAQKTPTQHEVTGFTSSVDVPATIAQWLSGAIPAGWDGCDLLGQDNPGREAAFTEIDFRDQPVSKAGLGADVYDFQFNMWRSERWVYVHFAAAPPLLFDLAADPGAHHNLGSDPGYGKVVRDCQSALLRHRMRHADNTLVHHRITKDGVVCHPPAPVMRNFADA